MALEWWEYYEINNKAKNLKKEIEELKKEVKALREKLKNKTLWGRFFSR